MVEQLMQRCPDDFEIDIKLNERHSEIDIYHQSNFYRSLIGKIVVRSDRVTYTVNTLYIEKEKVKRKYHDLYLFIISKIDLEGRELVKLEMNSRPKHSNGQMKRIA